MFKRIVLGIIILIGSQFAAWSTHIMGGEITWDCLPSGQFEFTMKIYRDCNGVNDIPILSVLNVYNHPTLNFISIQQISKKDISPKCDGSGPTISCAGIGSPGAIEEYIFKSNPVFIVGIPPAAGWIFVWQNCCRNGAIDNLVVDPVTTGFTLRAKMFSYNGKNTNPCFDSSPVFAERPAMVICTGYPFTYNHNAYDRELDSIVYDWAIPLDVMAGASFNATDPPPVPFIATYSYDNPFPGAAQNASNVPAILNQGTGEISFTSFTLGNYVTVIKASSYRCGQLTSEIYREIQVILLNCGANTPPTLTAPFQDQGGFYTEFADTVMAGDLVTFNLTATDSEFLPNGNPQTINLSATGSQFGTGFTDALSGCLNPPCAILTTPLPDSAQGSISMDFSWQTSCEHIFISDQCANKTNTYNFIIKAKDDYCPAPAQNIATVSVTIVASPVLEEPSIRCVEVQPNGDAIISWVIPQDTAGTFNSYHIYSSSSATGPFTLVDSVFTYAQSSYLHTGAAASTSSAYYYVQTRSGCKGLVYSSPSDTLQSIYLKAVNNISTGNIDLNWNPIHVPDLPTSFGWYRVYKEYPQGVWIFLDSTQGLMYSDPINICGDTISYRIEIEDESGCISRSNMVSEMFGDNTAPTVFDIDSVSVSQPGNLALITWPPSSSGDTKGYIIFMFNDAGGTWNPIDTVYGIGSTSYLNLNSNAGLKSEKYRVAVFDSCSQISPMNTFHETIHLNNSFDKCSGENTVTWNQYVNWTSGVSQYDIFISENGGPLTLLSTVSSATTSFIHTNLNFGSVYHYVVRASDGIVASTASSNMDSIVAEFPKPPLFEYIKFVSVKSDTEIDLSLYVDTSADVSSYKVMRSEAVAGPYQVVANFLSAAANEINFTDVDVFPTEKSYYYSLVAVDICNQNAMSSNLSRTILLEVDAQKDLTNMLTWNSYEGWPMGIDNYKLFRSLDGKSNYEWITDVPSGSLEYTDNVSSFAAGNGTFCYYIAAHEASGNPYGFKEFSLSNEACTFQESSIYVPNAVVPNGVSGKFKPIMAFVDGSTYLLRIFNRWGQIIFESTDPGEYWSAEMNGEVVEAGVYVFHLQVNMADGASFERRGGITVLH